MQCRMLQICVAEVGCPKIPSFQPFRCFQELPPGSTLSASVGCHSLPGTVTGAGRT